MSNDPLSFLDEPGSYRPTNRMAAASAKLPPPILRSLKPKPKRKPPVVAIVVAAAVGVLLLGLTAFVLPRAVETSADKTAVRNYLREHLDAGKWEEVRWWPARRVEKAKAKIVASNNKTLKERLEEIGRYQRTLDSNMGPNPTNTPGGMSYEEYRTEVREGLEKDMIGLQKWLDGQTKEANEFFQKPAPRVLRLKYRTLGAFDVLHDEYFEIENGIVSPAKSWCSDSDDFPE